MGGALCLLCLLGGALCLLCLLGEPSAYSAYWGEPSAYLSVIPKPVATWQGRQGILSIWKKPKLTAQPLHFDWLCGPRAGQPGL